MDTTETYPEATDHDLFGENEFVQYELASNGQRFFNYLIDSLFMQFAIVFVTDYLLSQFLLAVSPATVYSWFREGNLLASYTVALLNHLIYYSICEKAFKGYTLGKLITGTRAIREDGEELTFKDAFLRSLSRLVPFEALSIFGNGLWHDTWTKTRVIKSR